MRRSLGKNAVLNVVKTLMSVIFPLITFPYVSKVLGVDTLGKYNFSYSLNSFFVMLSALGITSYAVREGAPLREDKKNIGEFSSQIFSINVIAAVFAYFLLIICVLFIPKLNDYRNYILILSVEILFTTVGVEWLFVIYEEYLYITYRRIVFQIISLILVFLFVDESEDIILYCGITVFASAGANIINVIHSRKYCKIRFTAGIDWKKHLKPIITIFASTLAIKIYTGADTVMLGFLSNDRAVGLYSVAVKVYNVIKPLLFAVTTVAIPRLAAYAGSGRWADYNITIRKVFDVLFVLVLPAAVGICMLSSNIILLLSDAMYLEAEASLKILSVAVIFSIFSAFYNQCILIPLKMERYFLIATVASACVNVCGNFILIPLFNQNGAAITTVLAELTSMVMCYVAAHKTVKLVQKRHLVLTSAAGCTGVMLICCFVNVLINNLIIGTIVSIVCSVLVYFSILFMLKNRVVISGIELVKKKFLR